MMKITAFVLSIILILFAIAFFIPKKYNPIRQNVIDGATVYSGSLCECFGYHDIQNGVCIGFLYNCNTVK